jgi:putative oxidoreductase
MDYEACRKYEPLILRIFLGLTLLLLGYQKFTIENLADTFENLYGSLMVINAESFVTVLGVVQVVLGLAIILGLYTRVAAALLALMAVVTIILTCVLFFRHGAEFAYAFAVAGGAAVLFIEGSGAWSLDERIGSETPLEGPPE